MAPEPYAAAEGLLSACPLCSLACPLAISVESGRLAGARVLPEPGAELALECPLPARCLQALQAGPRLVMPFHRVGGRALSCDRATALRAAAERLRACLRRHGPASVGVLCSPSLGLEATWLVRQLAVEGLETTQLCSLGELLRGPRDDLDGAFGTTRSTCLASDLEGADLILLVGADPARAQPGLAWQIRRATQRGARLVALHSNWNELVSPQDLWLDPRRGSMATLLAALQGRVRALVRGLGPEPLSPAAQRGLAGIDPAVTARLARELVSARRVVAVYDLADTMERCEHDLPLLAGLLEELGQLGRRGTGLLLVGAEPGGGPSSLVELPGEVPGLRDGELRALLVVGEDPLASPAIVPWLSRLESLVVLDAYPSSTSAHADVALPLCTLAECRGTMQACDGRLRRLERCCAPPAGYGSLDLLVGLGEALGVSGLPACAEAIREEIAVEHGIRPELLDAARAAGQPLSRPLVYRPPQPVQLLPAPWPNPVVEEPRLRAELVRREVELYGGGGS
jgi:hypothetical protein